MIYLSINPIIPALKEFARAYIPKPTEERITHRGKPYQLKLSDIQIADMAQILGKNNMALNHKFETLLGENKWDAAYEDYEDILCTAQTKLLINWLYYSNKRAKYIIETER